MSAQMKVLIDRCCARYLEIKKLSRRNPHYNEIDWKTTITKNPKNYQSDYKTIIPKARYGFGRKRKAMKDIILCLDQSGSMGTSVICSGIFGSVLASILPSTQEWWYSTQRL